MPGTAEPASRGTTACRVAIFSARRGDSTQLRARFPSTLARTAIQVFTPPTPRRPALHFASHARRGGMVTTQGEVSSANVATWGRTRSPQSKRSAFLAFWASPFKTQRAKHRASRAPRVRPVLNSRWLAPWTKTQNAETVRLAPRHAAERRAHRAPAAPSRDHQSKRRAMFATSVLGPPRTRPAALRATVGATAPASTSAQLTNAGCAMRVRSPSPPTAARS